jgi:hypothetical protein
LGRARNALFGQPGNMLKEEVRADTKCWEWKEERDDLREGIPTRVNMTH